MAWEGRPAGPLAHPTPMPRGLGVEVPEPRTVPGLLLLFFLVVLSLCCGKQAFSPVAVRGATLQLQRVPEHRSSGCGHRLRCLKACGIFLDQESNPCLLRWQVDSLPLSHQEVLGPLPECPV